MKGSASQIGTVLDLFEQHAATSPDSIALLSPSGELSYRELSERVQHTAAFMRTQLQAVGSVNLPLAGTPPRIALHYPPSDNLVVGLLSALASGCCCVPIAATAPTERILALIEDAQPALLLGPAADPEELAAASGELKRFDVAAMQQEDRSLKSLVPHQARPVEAAVALYTSGTSGQPKAVLMTHQGFANLAQVHRDAFAIGKRSRALIYGSPVHGNWINSLLIALANGATAVVAAEDDLLPGPGLLDVLHTKQITHVHMPPTSLAALPPRELPHLKILTLGGEALAIDIVKPWLSQARIFNCYGATESNWMSFAEITVHTLNQLTIGRTIEGMEALVVDQHLQPVADGEVGELIMSGVGIARGYLGDEQLTREKFITAQQLGNKQWYRSGDLARVLEDGQYEVIGRSDAQLAIRGFRVEPGEIEATLIKHPAVEQAAVHGQSANRGTTLLVATLSLTPDQVLSVEELRDWLAELLPKYMIPSRFRVAPVLPLLANGKLDRRALTNLSNDPLPSLTCFDAPSTELEMSIARYWGEYTDEPVPHLGSDFFVAGGDSLGAVKLLWDISTDYGIDLHASDFFIKPTLAELVGAVEQAENSQASLRQAAELSVERLTAPLTPTQERLWSISRYSPEPALYNVPYLLELEGKLALDLLEFALRSVIARHAPLRSTVTGVSGQLTQQAVALENYDATSFNLSVEDLTAYSVAEAERRARTLVEEEANRPFDLDAELMPRATVIVLAPGRQQLLIVLHHLVCDGWSVANLFREMSQLYNVALAQVEACGTPELASHALPALTTSYFDYAHGVAQRASQETSQKYWEEHLRGAPTRLQLPTDYVYPIKEDYSGATRSRSLDAELVEGIEQLAIAHAVTASTVYLAAYFILLMRSGAGQDLTIGIPLIGHEQADTRDLIGLFASVLPHRCQLSSSTPIDELLQSVNKNLRLAIAHQSLPFQNSDAVESTAVTPARLLQSVFSHQNVLDTNDLNLRDVAATVSPVFPTTAKFELLVNVEKLSSGWTAIAEYRRALFDPETIDQLLSNYEGVLHALVRTQPELVGDLYWQAPASKRPESQPSGVDPVDERSDEIANTTTIHGLFERQCARDPQAIALVANGNRITYQVLNERADQFAAGLVAARVQTGSVVGLCLHRSAESAIAILGVLKAGCAYLPLPPDYPRERLEHMIREASAALVVGEQSSVEIGAGARQVVSYQTLIRSASNADAGSVLTPTVSADAVAYVMYTSGTSGSPNAVAVPHRGVTRLAHNPDYVRLTPASVTLQLAPTAFDASTFELWGAWLNGGCCVLFPGEQTNLAMLGDVVHCEGVNTLWLTSSLFNAVVDESIDALHGIESLLVGGEALSVDHIIRAQAALPDVQIINGYGPTECTTFACVYPIPSDFNPKYRRVPIGSAIQKTRTWVLDENRKPTAPGCVGELYIAGDGVALGYLDNNVLTNERFVTLDIGHGPTRAYKTGDLVVEQADGNLQFIGRIDQQIKVRGYRIEPEQVEQVLLRDPEVNRAAIVVRNHNDHLALVAVVETPSAASVELLDAVKARVNSQLTRYEQPATYLPIAQFPVTGNGKADRAALLSYVETQIDSQERRSVEGLIDASSKATNETEAWLLTLWSELLNTHNVHPEDNFFELGGDSLLAIRCMERIRQTFRVELPLSQLFEAGSARELSVTLESADSQRTQWSPLVSIRPAMVKTGVRNLFLVHSVGGEVLGFADFARYLDDDLAVYALQARGALDGHQPQSSLADMATDYVRELRDVQPAGPYRLGGISMGGLVAHEMAVQLVAAGEEVDYLLVGDTWFRRGSPLKARSRLRYVSELAKRLPQLRHGRQLRRARKEAEARRQSEEKSLRSPQRVRMREAHNQAMQAHVPGCFAGHVTLVRSNELSRAHLRDEVALGSPAMGWDQLASGGVTTVFLSGNHNNVFYGDSAKRFAQEISASMPTN